MASPGEAVAAAIQGGRDSVGHGGRGTLRGMEPIRVEKPAKERLDSMGVFSWPIWTKEVSTFDWTYDERETCYILAGRVRVEPAPGAGIASVEFGPGDLVVFPAGLSCTWKVVEAVRKHYRFG